jgi:hypothetical protein
MIYFLQQDNQNLKKHWLKLPPKNVCQINLLNVFFIENIQNIGNSTEHQSKGKLDKGLNENRPRVRIQYILERLNYF